MPASNFHEYARGVEDVLMTTQPIVPRCHRPSIGMHQQAWKSGQHRRWLRL
jgi:hypothetical protein